MPTYNHELKRDTRALRPSCSGGFVGECRAQNPDTQQHGLPGAGSHLAHRLTGACWAREARRDASKGRASVDS